MSALPNKLGYVHYDFGVFPIPYTVGAKTWYGTSTLMAAVHCARPGVLPAVRYAHPAYYVFGILLAPPPRLAARKGCAYHVQRFLYHRRTRHEINALSEDSEAVFIRVKLSTADRNTNLMIGT